jgi:hypothetical protein
VCVTNVLRLCYSVMLCLLHTEWLRLHEARAIHLHLHGSLGSRLILFPPPVRASWCHTDLLRSLMGPDV